MKRFVMVLSFLMFAGFLVVGNAMALPTDYFTTTDFTTGEDGTINFIISGDAGLATFGVYWVDDIYSPSSDSIKTLDVTFNTSFGAFSTGELSWDSDGALWDVQNYNGGLIAEDQKNVFGFYFLYGGTYYYTDTTLSGGAVEVIKASDTSFVFNFDIDGQTFNTSVSVFADDVAPVPEPATMLLLGGGLFGLAGIARKKIGRTIK